MKKRAIPKVPESALNFDLRLFLSSVKENIEIITGQRVTKIEPLSATATNDEIIAKVNQIIERLQ